MSVMVDRLKEEDLIEENVSRCSTLFLLIFESEGGGISVTIVLSVQRGRDPAALVATSSPF